ncbi:hypothetical protein Fmac_009328 [Flemingia macrophylla]|uniref:DUF7722 domain-containing protein n=1 Tax=Flemingia macrophylla TaxID=520843 RepID=A0ABD1N151_9FABA
MALRWLHHSTCHALGYPMNNPQVDQCKKIEGNPNGDVVKVSKNLNEVVDNPSSSCSSSGFQFQMPLHYPRYTKQDYDSMEEWKVDLLLKQYGLSLEGTLDEKRAFAVGAFLWPDQY